MKNCFTLFAVLILTTAVLTGCRAANKPTDTKPSATMPDMNELIPGPEDTINETNGANDHDPANGNTIDGESGKNESTATETTQETIAPRHGPKGRIIPRR